jgi:pilus assembly protein Flp/PilA
MNKLQALCDKTGREFRRFCANESGATAIEYALIAAGISIAIVVVVTGLGSSVKASFTKTSNALN